MVQRVGGSRRKTRSKFKKNIRAKGKVSVVSFFQHFDVGEKVLLKADPSVHAGMYHARFHAKVGKVLGYRGKCVKVEIVDGSKPKLLILHPVHLRRCQKQK